MSRASIWIFDVTTERLGGGDSIVLWGLRSDGVVTPLVDTSFEDHIYVAGLDVEEVRERASVAAAGRGRIRVEPVRRRYRGVELEVARVSGEQEAVKAVAKALDNVADVFEADVRLSQKYILYRGVKPSRWYEAVYEDLERPFYPGAARLVELNEGADAPPPSLKTLALEFITLSRLGSPDPDRDPLVAVALYWGEEVEWISGDERSLFERLSEIVSELDPDVILSFGGNRVFYPYLVERAGNLGVSLRLGRYPGEIYQSVLGHFSIGGRINVDLYEYVDDSPIFQMKTLEELTAYLGLSQPRVRLDPHLYAHYWESDREALREYVGWRVVSIYNSFEVVREEVVSLSAITGIPMDYVLTSSSGRRIEFYVMGEAVKRGELIPPQVERRVRSYQGGLVLQPRPGLHRDIAVIDFKSMYPSIMMRFNISPETVVEGRVENGEYFEELGLSVRRDIEGLFPSVLGLLLSMRDETRRMMEGLSRSDPMYRVLDARQRTLKILANTVYGYMGWGAARWYSAEAASLVTFIGRRMISRSMDRAREMGLEVIYGDTDSLFIRHDPAKVDRLLGWISEYLGMEAKVEKVYRRLLFTSAKKRYAGVYDGVIDIVGLEYNRRDWCGYARELQGEVVAEVLRVGGVGRSLEILREYVSRLRRGEVPLEKLVIWEQITRPLDEYRVNAPHVEVARELARRGWRIGRGVFIGYVVTRGEGPIYKRAVHYLEADPSMVDVNYYIEHQLIPVVHRVLEPLGVPRKRVEAAARHTGRGLDAFM